MRSEKSSLGKKLSEKEKEFSELDIEIHKLGNKAGHLKELSDNLTDYARRRLNFLLMKKGKMFRYSRCDKLEDRFKIAIETALGEMSNYIILDESTKLDTLIDKLSDNQKVKLHYT
ncbi:MAG: hypothetical protein IPM38_09305 [Ignavibacteria bacterium]|nr:hypothetical protein [Ignavibacteria bacterium]